MTVEEKPEGWRGSGVSPTGGLRIRNLGISIGADGIEHVKPITVEVRTDTWQHWLEVAREARDQGRVERAAGVAAGDDNAAFGQALEREFRRSMASLSASVFAIDAFYGGTVAHAPEAKVQAKKRWAKIAETLKCAYALRGRQPAEVTKVLKQLFHYRDDAVHPPERFIKPAAHPVYGLGMEPRFLMFRVENAEAAHTFCHELIWFCLRNPKSKYPKLVEWAEPRHDWLPRPEGAPED